jgi:hypothetical protein
LHMAHHHKVSKSDILETASVSVIRQQGMKFPTQLARASLDHRRQTLDDQNMAILFF